MLWRELLESCACETNLDRLEKLVFDMEDAIVLRFRELSTESHCDEFQALKQAAKTLLDLKIRKLGWPDPVNATPAN